MSSFPRRNASAVLRDVFAREREKRSRAEERKKKHFFFRGRTSRRQVTEEETSPSLRFRLRGERRRKKKRKARDGQRRRARRRTRVFFTRIRAFARKIARFAKKAAIRGGGRRRVILRGARRLPQRRVVGALRAVRPTARASTLLKTPSTPKHTRSEDCFGTSLLHQPKSRSELG